MRAATIRDGEIVVAEHPDPSPGPGEVLVRVRAAGLNGADQMQVLGFYPPPPGSGVPDDIPGLELAGEVAEVGRDAGRFRPGDRVMAIVPEPARPSSPCCTSVSSCRYPASWAGRKPAASPRCS